MKTNSIRKLENAIEILDSRIIEALDKCSKTIVEMEKSLRAIGINAIVVQSAISDVIDGLQERDDDVLVERRGKPIE